MKKILIFILLSLSTVLQIQALIVNEIMSNPVGDDGGREWIEIYNDSDEAIDLSTVTVSIKGGSFLPVTSLQGGYVLAKNGYAIISSTVSGTSKFLQDYPNFTGILLKSSISLVNTGVTSVELKVGGQTSGGVLSYTAAKEGNTYALLQGAFSLGVPTPGEENQAASNSGDGATASSTTGNQSTLVQTSAPSADVVLYLPFEKTVVAGAEANFSTYGMTHAGKLLDHMSYMWSFGDGGQGTGSSTRYTYNYPGRYIAQVEGGNGAVVGVGRIRVRVVSPDVYIKDVSSGKYGAYIDIENPNSYDLDFSQWKLSIDGALFPFPKNTLIAGNGVTRFSGLAMGFASTTIASSTIVKILFPTLEEVARYSLPALQAVSASSNTSPTSSTTFVLKTKVKDQSKKMELYALKNKPAGAILGVLSTGSSASSSGKLFSQRETQRDTRIIKFLKSLF